jgi:hypothetical protein
MKAHRLLLPFLFTSSLFAKDLIYDETTKLLWQDSFINKDASISYKEAQNYCKFLSVKNYKDFRLPTLHELQTIVDYKNYKPAILDGFHFVDNTSYWTTTPFADDNTEVWTINFEKGSRSTKAVYYNRHFRCVQKLK